MKEEVRREALEEGRMQAERTLEEKQIWKWICRKLERGRSLEEIADALECNPEEIAEKVAFASDFAPEYEVEKVFAAWQEKCGL